MSARRHKGQKQKDKKSKQNLRQKPKLNKNIVAGLGLVVACAVLAGGIVAAVDGEREFHPHHEDDSAEEYSE